MGQGIIDGYLPYVKIWDAKPPLAFATFAGLLLLVGKNLVALRLVGALCVILTSYLVYRAGYLITKNKVPACIAALVSTTMISLFMPNVLTEILCVVPLSTGLVLLFHDDIGPARAFLVGTLLGFAVMIRTNLGVVALMAGAFIIFSPSPSHSYRLLARALTTGLAYAVGVSLVICATAVPYLVAGRLQLWFDSVVRAGLELSSEGFYSRSLENVFDLVRAGFGIHPSGTVDRFAEILQRSSESVSYWVLLLGAVLWIGGLIGMARCYVGWRQFSSPLRNGVVATSVFLSGATISVGLTGWPFAHYLVQLVPWFGIFLAAAIGLGSGKTTVRGLVVGTIGGGLVTVALQVGTGYYLLLRRIEQGNSLTYGASYEIAKYLESEPDAKSIYLASDQLVYWLLGTYPPTRLSTFPGNIAMPVLITAVEGPNGTPEREMRKIIQEHPTFIVKPRTVRYLSGRGLSEVEKLLDEALARDYTLETVIEGRQVFRRKPILFDELR
jgi:4-amino-4-deoxy-L-arabinose transferase-like glycosyltransferase